MGKMASFIANFSAMLASFTKQVKPKGKGEMGGKFLRMSRKKDGSSNVIPITFKRQVPSPLARAKKAKRKKINKITAHSRRINRMRSA